MLFSTYRYEKGVSKPTDSPTLLLDILTDYSHRALCSFYFWVVLVAVTLIEPILCAYYPTGAILAGQVTILVVGSVLFAVQLLGELHVTWNNIPISPSSLRELWGIVYYFFGRGEYLLEGGGLLVGWVFLFSRPGLAILRCFRIFRLLWLYRVTIFKATLIKYLDPIVGAVFIERSFQVCAFAIRSLSALSSEMFRLTKHTRGGLLLMLILFYNAFIFGAVLWVETGNEPHSTAAAPSNSTALLPTSASSSNTTTAATNGSCTTYVYTSNNYYDNAADDASSSPCATMPSCMYLMLRLTFFDGNGLDFVYTLTKDHKFLFFLVMVYLCITAFGVINGLVGIFGTAFTIASEECFQDIDEEELKQSTAKMLADHDPKDNNNNDNHPNNELHDDNRDANNQDASNTLPLPVERYPSGAFLNKQRSTTSHADHGLHMDTLSLDLENAGHGPDPPVAAPAMESRGKSASIAFSVASLVSGTSAKEAPPRGRLDSTASSMYNKSQDAPGGVDMQTIAFLRRQRALPPPTDHQHTHGNNKQRAGGGMFASKPLFKSSLEASDILQLLLEMKSEIADLKEVVQAYSSASTKAETKKSPNNLMRRMSRMFTTTRRQSKSFNLPVHRRLSPGHPKSPSTQHRNKSPPSRHNVAPPSVTVNRGKANKLTSQRSPVNATSHPLSPRRSSGGDGLAGSGSPDVLQGVDLCDIIVQNNTMASPQPPSQSSSGGVDV